MYYNLRGQRHAKTCLRAYAYSVTAQSDQDPNYPFTESLDITE